MTTAPRMLTRFAPSPTGDLHLGGAWTALASWALARAASGRVLLRVEDIDTPRVVAGSAARIEDDLAWLGLGWDETSTQSERFALYDEAIEELTAAGLTYPCDCSRAEIAQAASAPHAGEELVYPGTCRDAPPSRAFKRPPAIRVRVPAGTTVGFDDLVRGPVVQQIDIAVGDFVLRRGDGVYAYQLAVAFDDASAGVTHVVRADDLLASTARQLMLMRMLGFTSLPRYAHLPLVVEPTGERLAKRSGSATVRELRDRGVSPEELVGCLASGLGLVGGPARPRTAAEVARELAPPATWRKEPWPVPPAFQRSAR